MAALNHILSKPKVISIAAAEETNSTCLELIKRYYDALGRKPDAWPLDRFYNKASRHVYLQSSGERPVEAVGLDQIKSFVENTKFDRCAFEIDSIYARQPWPTRFTVFAVGRLSHPGRAAPRKFEQTTVFVRFPPSKTATNKGRRYLVLKTVFKFVDRVKDDKFFTAAAATAVNDPKKDGPTATTTTKSPSEKQTAIAVINITTSTTDEKRAGTTPGQSTAVVANDTISSERIKEELSNDLVPKPSEKSTAAKKLSKNMKRKLKRHGESARREKPNTDDAKLLQKCPSKRKTKYTKLCEMTEIN